MVKNSDFLSVNEAAVAETQDEPNQHVQKKTCFTTLKDMLEYEKNVEANGFFLSWSFEPDRYLKNGVS